jgi:hypothetical protein
VSNAFIDNLHEEAIALLLAARDCAVSDAATPLPDDADPMERLSVKLAELHLTALVTDAVAWTLAQKAYAAGQLSDEEVAAECWAPEQLTFESTAAVPARLAELIEKAQLFHRRVTHLHARRQAPRPTVIGGD